MSKVSKSLTMALIMSLSIIFSMFMLSACGEKKMFTIKIQQDMGSATNIRYVIGNGEENIKVHEGHDREFTLTMKNGYAEVSNPVINIINDSGTDRQYTPLWSANNKSFTIKNIRDNLTLSFANPPKSKCEVKIYNGEKLLSTVSGQDSKTFNKGWLDNLKQDGKYLVGVFEDKECTIPYDFDQELKVLNNVYTKWSFTPYLYSAIGQYNIFENDQVETQLLLDVSKNIAVGANYNSKVFAIVKNFASNPSCKTSEFSVNFTNKIIIQKMFSSDTNDYSKDYLQNVTGEVVNGRHYYTLLNNEIKDSILISFAK